MLSLGVYVCLSISLVASAQEVPGQQKQADPQVRQLEQVVELLTKAINEPPEVGVPDGSRSTFLVPELTLARDELFQARLESAETPGQKITRCEEYLKATAGLKKQLEAMYQANRLSRVEIEQVAASMANAKVMLLKAKQQQGIDVDQELKQAHNERIKHLKQVATIHRVQLDIPPRPGGGRIHKPEFFSQLVDGDRRLLSAEADATSTEQKHAVIERHLKLALELHEVATQLHEAGGVSRRDVQHLEAYAVSIKLMLWNAEPQGEEQIRDQINHALWRQVTLWEQIVEIDRIRFSEPARPAFDSQFIRPHVVSDLIQSEAALADARVAVAPPADRKLAVRQQQQERARELLFKIKELNQEGRVSKLEGHRIAAYHARTQASLKKAQEAIDVMRSRE